MARDTIERDGEQLVVETGTGLVESFDEKPGKRNAQVTFKATHTNLRDPVTGWLDTFDQAAAELVRDALEQRFELEYRVEVHRLAKVDKSIPIAEVGKRDKIRDLVHVALVADGGAKPPPRDASTEDAPARADDPSPKSEPIAPTDPPAAPKPRRGPKVAEARPWEEMNSDGSPNLGAYAVQAAAGMVDLAVEILVEAEREVTPSVVRFVATRLIEAADEIQAGVRPDGRYDRMDNSHTRARGVLRTVLRLAAFPLEVVDDKANVSNVDVVHTWHRRTVHAGVALLTLALDLSGIDWRDNTRGAT